MGDGSVASYGIKIGTDSFSIKECVLLINVLIIKYNIDCTIHLNNDKPRIYILSSSKDKLISLIKPYIIPSMFYKLGIHLNNNNLLTLESTKSNLIKSILESKESISFLKQDDKITNNFSEKEIISIIVGSLLGYCQMIKIKTNNYVLINKVNTNKKNYLLLIYNKLAELGYCKNIDTNFEFIANKKNYYNCFKFFINLNWIYEMFYPKVKKVIPKDLSKVISPLSLAIWILNDGTLIKNKGIKFTANNFTLKETKIFSNILFENYKLKTSFVKTGVVNQYNLYILKYSKNTFKEIINSFIPNTILEKLFFLNKNLKFQLTKINTKNIQVEVTDINTNITINYNSIRKAALALNVDKSALLRNEKINKLFKGKYLINIKR
jgi:hypothetical protein